MSSPSVGLALLHPAADGRERNQEMASQAGGFHLLLSLSQPPQKVAGISRKCHLF